MSLEQFHPLVRDWFKSQFSEPTPAQRAGWPVIQKQDNALILVPTGSGKTLERPAPASGQVRGRCYSL